MKRFLVFLLAATALLAADPVQALFDKSVAALAAGEYATAEQGFWAVLKARPDNIGAYGNLGVVYTRTHQYTKAIEVYAHGLDVAPAEPGLLLNLGLAYIQQAQYANALPVFAKLVKVSPGNKQARELLATCQLYTGNLYTALESLQALKSADPRNTNVLRLLALTYYRMSQPEKAQAVFAELRSSAPPGEANLAIGRTQFEIGHFEESVESIRKALRADPRLPDARRELGKALLKAGQDGDAERELSLATMQDHDDGEAYYFLGSMELQEEKLTQASAHLEAARELLPDFGRLLPSGLAETEAEPSGGGGRDARARRAAQSESSRGPRAACPGARRLKVVHNEDREVPDLSVTIGVPAETFPGERRVAMTPRGMDALLKSGAEFIVESGAGAAAGFPDRGFAQKGARIAEERREVFAADIILQVRTLGANPDEGLADLRWMRPGQIVIGFGDPLSAATEHASLAGRGITGFAMELIPRITRAQSMDALSSMATVAGYKAVLLAADTLPRMFPLLMTAAGTVTPAHVFVLGAGVAGLQAIATARRLGAVVQAYDVRPAAREQIESLGAKSVTVDLDTSHAEGAGGYARELGEDFYRRQRVALTEVLRQQDVVIATAAAPGKKAPILITRDMVAGMPPGSVIVDLAAERGGNCELTRPHQTVVESGVTILGPLNLASTVPYHASLMYSRNVAAFVGQLLVKGSLVIDPNDEIVRETLVTRGGEVVHPRVLELLQASPEQSKGD